MLEVNGLVVNQGDFVLKADFSLKPGDMVAVIGPSGGGKSTLLSTIAGFINVVSGSVFLNDLQISKLIASEVPCTLLFRSCDILFWVGSDSSMVRHQNGAQASVTRQRLAYSLRCESLVDKEA